MRDDEEFVNPHRYRVVGKVRFSYVVTTVQEINIEITASEGWDDASDIWEIEEIQTELTIPDGSELSEDDLEWVGEPLLLDLGPAADADPGPELRALGYPDLFEAAAALSTREREDLRNESR